MQPYDKSKVRGALLSKDQLHNFMFFVQFWWYKMHLK